MQYYNGYDDLMQYRTIDRSPRKEFPFSLRLHPLWLLLFAFCLPSGIAAQSATDSARQRDHLPARILGLCEDARRLAVTNRSAAIDCTEKAMADAKNRNDQAAMAEITSVRAFIHSQATQWTEAVQWYERSRSIFRALGDSNGVAMTCCRLGDIHRFAGKLQSAQRAYGDARALFGSTEPAIRAETLFGMAALLQLQNRLDEALQSYRQAADLAQHIGLHGIRSNSMNNIAAILDLRGNPAAAHSHYTEALQLAEISGNARRMIRIRINVAAIQHVLKDRQGARTLYQKAFSQAAHIRDIALMTDAYNGFLATTIETDTPGGGPVHSSVRADSLLLGRSIGVVFEHESSRQEREYQLLKEQQRLQSLAMEHEREQTRRLELEYRQNEQELQLLQSEHEIQDLNLQFANSWLELERTKKEEQEAAYILSEKNRLLQQDIIERETLIRNILITSVVLLLVIGFLLVRRFKDRRSAIELKAQVAEARAAALESEKRQGDFEARKRFTHLLIDSQEQERKRIAADLHDGIGQDLLVIKNRLKLALREQGSGGDPTHELEEISVAVTSSLQDIRRISRNLRPSQLDRIGLTSSIDTMIRNVQESTDIILTPSLENIDELFSKEREIDIFRIVQEGLNNIIKHSHAGEATISIQRRNGDVTILICDNGEGFDIEQIKTAAEFGSEGFGLRGLYERTEILGGNINIDSTPGAGTRIMVSLPVPESSLLLQSLERNMHAGR